MSVFALRVELKRDVNAVLITLLEKQTTQPMPIVYRGQYLRLFSQSHVTSLKKALTVPSATVASKCRHTHHTRYSLVKETTRYQHLP